MWSSTWQTSGGLGSEPVETDVDVAMCECPLVGGRKADGEALRRLEQGRLEQGRLEASAKEQDVLQLLRALPDGD